MTSLVATFESDLLWGLLLGARPLFALAPNEGANGLGQTSSQLGQEAELIRRIQGGDRRAFEELFRRHVDEVHRRLTRILGPDPEREDLVQEVFLAAYRGLASFRGEASFSTWLYRIVTHVAYSRLRRRRWYPLDEKTLHAIDRLVDEGPSEEAAAARRQEVRHALELLERIKPKKRIAFVLRVVEGLSLQEIGEIVDATPAAVGQRIIHAQRELQRLLERESRQQRGGASA